MITYRNDKKINSQQLAQVFERSGINRPVQDLERLQTMLEHANLLWTAWDGEQLVGVARSLTDFSYVCYLSDLAVDKAYQKQGIGKALVEKTKDQLGSKVALILLAAPSAMDYYPKIGLDAAPNAFIIKRD